MNHVGRSPVVRTADHVGRAGGGMHAGRAAAQGLRMLSAEAEGDERLLALMAPS